MGRLLGLNFWETEAFLKEKQAYLPYDESELARDRAKLLVFASARRSAPGLLGRSVGKRASGRHPR